MVGSEGVTYLKLFISHEYVDLSHLEISSPFRVDKTDLKMPGVVPTEAHAGSPHTSDRATLRPRSGAPANHPPGLWDTICIPIVKKTNKRETPQNMAPKSSFIRTVKRSTTTKVLK